MKNKTRPFILDVVRIKDNNLFLLPTSSFVILEEYTQTVNMDEFDTFLFDTQVQPSNESNIDNFLCSVNIEEMQKLSTPVPIVAVQSNVLVNPKQVKTLTTQKLPKNRGKSLPFQSFTKRKYVKKSSVLKDILEQIDVGQPSFDVQTHFTPAEVDAFQVIKNLKQGILSETKQLTHRIAETNAEINQKNIVLNDLNNQLRELTKKSETINQLMCIE